MFSTLEKSEYPTDFYYHRTASPTYRAYLETCGLTTIDIDHPPQFAWRKKIFGNFFGIIKQERVAIEPYIAALKASTGLKHAFVVWIPYGSVDIPSPWRRLWFTDHFEETGYAKLSYDKSNYQNIPSHTSWNERSRRALKKCEQSGTRIEYVDPDTFLAAFGKAKVRHWYKGAYISYYKKMVSIDAEKIRQWIAYAPDGTPVAGLAVHDYLDTHSVHLVAFTDPRYYSLQAGTGLMDAWFRDSYEKKYTYLSLDHLRNTGGPKDQKGYTAFKENFLTAHLSFKEAYFRFF